MVLPSSSGGEPEPIAPPVTEAPPPPPTPDQVAPMALAIAAYFEFGTRALITQYPELGTVVNLEVVVAGLPKMKAVVHGAAERVLIKYNLRGIPYQDEIIIASAVGFATFGLVPRKRKSEDAQAAPRTAPPNAKNANARPAANANANASRTAPAHDPTEPVTPTEGDFRP